MAPSTSGEEARPVAASRPAVATQPMLPGRPIWRGLLRAPRTALVVVVLAGTAAPSVAQQSEAVLPPIVEYVEAGPPTPIKNPFGPALGVLVILLGLAAAAMTMVFAVTMRRNVLMPPALVGQLKGLVGKGQIAEARRLCDGQGGLCTLLGAAFKKAGTGQNSAYLAMSFAARKEKALMKERVHWLLLLVVVVLLLGLALTAVSLMLLYNVEAAYQWLHPCEKAEGLSYSLQPTARALMVAIPLLVAYRFFDNRTTKLAREMKRTANDLLSRVPRSAFGTDA